ncbi:flagellar basal-body MS-ring/collar protein FliF [Photobacterium kishitanii]|uniref:flagellar basal-body MS-ring/collar protein FliF n=1 Tax=Photobacterium kishitanii TaxID=318456 RepID=UPI0015E73AD0|nr:flagellar basal-body MS-ring/collar protein FliF [Photobacterium kishitanii]
MQDKLNKIKDSFESLSFNKKALASAILMSGIAVSGLSIYKLNQPDYVSVISGLDRGSLQKIIPALETAKITFKISADDTTLFVDSDEADQASIVLAKNGLPGKPTSGYDHLRNTDSPYLTKSAEDQLSRQVLEENVASAIKKLTPIADVQVRLALSKNSQFLQDVDPASASIVLTVKQGQHLNKSQIQGIANLVANAVPNLSTDNVIILDQTGRVLSSSDDLVGAASSQLDHKLQIEKELTNKVTEVIAPIVGLDSVRVNVNATVDYNRTELTSETPADKTVILSQQKEISYDKSLTGGQGVPGSLSNEPPKHSKFDKSPKSAPEDDNNSGVSHKNITTNYSVGQTIEHTVKSSGSIKKLDVAVLIDSSADKNLPIDKITALVKSSIGFNAERGDTVTISDVAFKKIEPQKEEVIPFTSTALFKTILKFGENVALLILFYFLFFRNALKIFKKEDKTTEDASGADNTIIDADKNEVENSEKDIDPIVLSDEEISIEYDRLKNKTSEMFNSSPDAIRDVFTSWLNNIDFTSNDVDEEDQDDSESNDQQEKEGESK